MTIKRRLFISNILMSVIPYLLSMVIVTSGLFVISLLTEYEFVLIPFRRDIVLGDNGRGTLAIIIMVAVLIFFGIVMVLTNRLLTKFVFKKIEQSLVMLSASVKHISDGDLDYRIDYSNQDEFKPICESFNDMAVKLQTANDMVQKNEQNRKELFSSISHDLRSPLTSIKAFAEGLIDGVASTPESQKEYLQVIIQKANEVNSMVSQLFLYSKMDMGSYPTNPEMLDIGNEIEEFISVSQDEYKTKGLSIKTDGKISNANIYADPLQLRSIFTNIFDNSVKYKKKETVTSKVTCFTEGGFVKIILEDNGPGVEEKELTKLFDAFYRADPSRNNPQQGSGLGLAIVSKALERMNGSISAENGKKGGLRIIIKIPFTKGAAS